MISFSLASKITWVGLLVMAVVSVDAAPPPHFKEHTIATGLTGGYQVVVADLNRDGKPDLIALASGMSELVWFENPGWQRHVIASNFDQMINCAVLNTGTRPLIVLASGFSNEARKSQGNIWVLEPESAVQLPWKVREIDRLPTSHRVRLADIEGSGGPVVINTPLTGANAVPPDYRGRVPLVYYRPGEWRRTLISDENEGVQHGLWVVDWDGDHRDEILTASFSGIHRYKLEANGGWTRTEIARGAPTPWPKCGASDIAVGRLGTRRFICSIEPWHGNQLVIYHEEKNGWLRQVIDDSLRDGHALLTADFNHDGREAIVAGYRGQGGGVMYYSAEDDLGLRWTRHDIDIGGITAASCALADLNGDGRMDLVCIGSATANLKWYENQE